jgi:outer membrane protein assembly factor BamD (BamD/ComL family)
VEAKRLDPAHFSRPQWTLAQIYLRTGDPKAAAAELEEFIRLHPDSPDRERARAAIEELKK